MKLDSQNENSMATGPLCREACCSGTGNDAEPKPAGDNTRLTETKLFSLSAIKPHQQSDALPPTDRSAPGETATVLRVSGMDCGDCAAKLAKRIANMPGVHSAIFNFGAGKLVVEHSIADSTLIQAVQQAGYGAVREDKTSRQPVAEVPWWKSSRTLATAVSALLLVIATLLDWLETPGSSAVWLYALTAVIGGFHPARSGLYGLRSGSFDMNFLMTAAIIGAAAIGEWSEGAAVAVLFSVGNTLQIYTLDKTRRSIRLLMDLAPPEALVQRGNEEIRMSVDDIVIGDMIIVKPGERIAMDGLITTGSSAINQSTITGESIPVEKAIGDSVYAGTINEHGALTIRVTRTANNSTLARISHLVEEAQAQKAPSQQFVDVFAKYYTPFVLAAAAGVMILPWLLFHQSFAPWFYNGLVLLVISCPCALVISTPVSIVAAIGNASRRGVLIKGGAILEEMGAIRAIAFDKTGTLTQGRPVVTDIVVNEGISQTDFLTLAAGIEKWSEHPLAQAIVARAKGLELCTTTHFKALVGRGAQAEVRGKMIYIGNLRLFAELGHDLIPFQDSVAVFEQQGKTVMLLGDRERLFGMIAVADTLRQDSKAAIQALHTAGMSHIAMLTGDNDRTAKAIAEQLDLDSFYSELLPEDKVAAVKKIAAQYGKLVMVGDGVNDSPALAAATVGVAMGVAGADVALETADVTLMTDDLSKLAYIIKLSHKTVAIIKENIAFAISIKLIFLLLLTFGMANLWLAVLADMGASLLVTLNGMRLMRRLDNSKERC